MPEPVAFPNGPEVCILATPVRSGHHVTPAHMPAQKIRCPKCAQEADATDQFCPSCGYAHPGAAYAPAAVSPFYTPTTGPGAKDKVIDRLRRATAGRFDVKRRLGVGGMAAVYLAYDMRLDRKVALKVMLPQLELVDGMAARFADEGRKSAKLYHPNVMLVHEVIDDLDDLVMLVMKLIEGASLEQVVPCVPPTPSLELRRLPVSAALSVLVQVAAALEYAHAQGVFHRDIKPSNVMITVDGDAIITDFGIAKVTDIAHTPTSSTLMGTPTYMSPEQWKGQQITGASDQYSLGVMAYELLVGEPPFIGPMLDVYNAHVEREPVAVQLRRPDVPLNLAAAVMRMLAKRPAERFGSMTTLADAIGVNFDRHDAAPRKLLGAAAVTAITLRDATEGEGFHTPRSPIFPSQVRASTIVVNAPKSVMVGQTFPVIAFARDASGRELSEVAITLASEKPDVAAVKGQRATALAPGVVRIIATGGGVVGDAVVAVTAPPESPTEDQTVVARPEPPRVASLRINPLPGKLHVGKTMVLVATPLDDRGAELAGRSLKWSSDSPEIASVVANGFVKARRPGRVHFTCDCDGIVATSELLVVSNIPTWLVAPLVVAAVAVAVYFGFIRHPASKEPPIESFFAPAVRVAIANEGYAFGGVHVVEDFSSATGSGGNVREGRFFPEGDSTNATRDTSRWNVRASNFAAHFDIRYEGGRIGQGSGLYLGAADPPGTTLPHSYLLLLRSTTPQSYRLLQRAGLDVRDVVRATPTSLLTQGNNRVDVLLIAGTMRVYINESLVTSTPPLAYYPDGRFGVYVSPGEQYSFDNIVVSALTHN